MALPFLRREGPMKRATRVSPLGLLLIAIPAHVVVDYHGDSLVQKDKVIGLLKAAAGRL